MFENDKYEPSEFWNRALEDYQNLPVLADLILRIPATFPTVDMNNLVNNIVDFTSNDLKYQFYDINVVLQKVSSKIS